jgi:anti-sigma B factor antagonist
MPASIELNNDLCRIRIQGEMTIYTALDLRQALVPCLDRAARVDIDLSEVNEMDSAGVQLLMLMKREMAGRGTSLMLTAHSQAVTDVIDTFNLAAFFGDPIVLRNGKRGSGKRKAKKEAEK